jgi:hypothetical protein
MQSVRGSVKHVFFKGNIYRFFQIIDGGIIGIDDVYNEIELHHHFYELQMAPKITQVIIDDISMPVIEYLTHYKDIDIPKSLEFM